MRSLHTCAAKEGWLLQHWAAKGAEAARQHELQAPERLERRHCLLWLAAWLRLKQDQVLAYQHCLLLPLGCAAAALYSAGQPSPLLPDCCRRC